MDDAASASTKTPSAPGAAEPKPNRFPALESRNFRILWLGLIASNVGTWMALTAEGWLVTELAPDRAAVSLGLVAGAFALPMLVLPPFGGALADRVPRLRLLWAAQLVYITASVVVAVLTLTGNASVALLVVNSFVTGVVLAVDSPTRHALLPALVSRAQLTSAISLNSAVFSGAGLIGPAIAGALIPAIGVGGIFVVNAVSYLIVIWALTQLEGVPQMSDRARVPGSVVGTIARGVGYVRRDALIGALLLLSILSGLLGRSVGALLPVFARDVYGVGSVAFGFLAAAPGLGTLVGSIWLASRAKVGAKGRWVVLTTLGLSLALLAFAWSRWYPVSLPLLAGLGLCASIGSGLIATLIQLRVPDELRGRVMGLFVLTLIGVPSLGSLLAGAVAEVVGVRETVAGSAALLALLTLLAYGRGRALRDAD